MLKLRDITRIEKIQNESDFYIKIKIIFEGRNPMRDPICYWSSLGPKESLIEIGIKKINGAIYEITVITMPTIHYQELPEINKNNIIRKIGLPLFETNKWKLGDDPSEYYPKNFTEGYYIRELADFEIYADKNNTSILLSPNHVTLHVINPPVTFGLDSENNLCFIRMEGMALNEVGFLEYVNPVEQS